MPIESCTAIMTRYGYPVAHFAATTLAVASRKVVVRSIIWDAEYGCYRAIGHYAKKDGTAGQQIAKPLMSLAEVPPEVRDAIKAVDPTAP